MDDKNNRNFSQVTASLGVGKKGKMKYNKKMDNILETKKTKKVDYPQNILKALKLDIKNPTEDQKAGLNHIRK